MKRLCLATLILSIAFSSPVKSAEDKILIGAGRNTCANFSKDYKENPEIFEKFYFSWAQGFMTAINFSIENNQMLSLDVFSTEVQMSHIRSFCADKPLRSYMDAVFDLLVKIDVAQPINKPN